MKHNANETWTNQFPNLATAPKVISGRYSKLAGVSFYSSVAPLGLLILGALIMLTGMVDTVFAVAVFAFCTVVSFPIAMTCGLAAWYRATWEERSPANLWMAYTGIILSMLLALFAMLVLLLLYFDAVTGWLRRVGL